MIIRKGDKNSPYKNPIKIFSQVHIWILLDMNSGNTFPQFEMIDCNTLYTITINPDNDHQYWGSTNRLQEWYSKNNILLKNTINDSAKLELFPEVSQVGRLHFHGTIKIFDKIKFYINVIPQLLKFNHIEVDTIEDIDVWDKYILKQNELHNYCLRLQLPIPMAIGIDFKKMTKNFFSAPAREAKVPLERFSATPPSHGEGDLNVE